MTDRSQPSLRRPGKLREDSVVKESFTTAADGKNSETKLYNLDAVSQSIRCLTQAGRKTQSMPGFHEGELVRASVVAESATTAAIGENCAEVTGHGARGN